MIVANPPFESTTAIVAVFMSWLISQLAKVARGMRREKRFNFRWLFDTGGMPSAHSATVSSLTVVVGFYYGFTSLPFLFVGIFSLITMFDAAGVRRSVGRQAAILNKMISEFSEKGFVGQERVKELLGHTPVEVFAGSLLGITIALLFYFFVWS